MAQRAEAAIEIEAPIEAVWRVMLDLGAYGEWNPFIVRVEGAPPSVAVGSRFRLHVRWSSGGGARSDEEVTVIEPPAVDGRARFVYRFVGGLDRFGLVRAERVQELEQRAGGPTRYRSVEEFRGLLARFIPLAQVQEGFERHARALKARAEAIIRGAAATP